jgi:PAS domain S-box-containing protein
MADSAPMMVWLSGPDGGRTYVNQRWLDFTGRELDHELSESWMANIHHDDQPDVARTLSAALAEERPFTVEYRLERRDREYRWVLDHGVPRRSDDGALLGYVGSAVDVTQLRAAQRALLETDLLRSAIFGALHGHVAALDKSGRIIAVNHAWSRFAVENGGNPIRVSIGASYLDVCQDAARAGDRDAGRILEALRTVLAARRHAGPMLVQKALYPEGETVCHNIVLHPPGGIVGGDRLDITLDLQPLAHAVITTPGATRFYRSAGAAGIQHVQGTLGHGARLEWLPLESIAHSGCIAHNHAQFLLANDAEMIGWDVLALGLPAAGEAFSTGRFEQHLELPGATSAGPGVLGIRPPPTGTTCPSTESCRLPVR